MDAPAAGPVAPPKDAAMLTAPRPDDVARARAAIEAAGASPAPDSTAVEIVQGADLNLLLLADHASNARPSRLGDLGLAAADLSRHIAYDIGARGVTLGLAALLRAPALLSTFSRLVIDPNRGLDDPTLLMRLYDRTIIPANAAADANERAARIEAFHRPYSAAIEAALAAGRAETGRWPMLLSIHSYTRALRGRSPRPWRLGVLWEDDPVSGALLTEALRAAAPTWAIGDNEPYKGALPGDTMNRHGGRERPHALLEIRNDLIETREQQAFLAAGLAPILADVADRRRRAG